MTEDDSPLPDSPSDQAPPRVPNYELVRRIGKGSYGEVWLARNLLGEWHAVKVVYRSAFSEDCRHYEREWKGIQRYEPASRMHESLVPILYVGRDDASGCFYYVMELADDVTAESGQVGKWESEGAYPPAHSLTFSPASYTPRTLRHDLKHRGRLPVDECVEIGASLAMAVEQLHQHQLIHRDIKPSNIVFIHGRAKLADIGLVTNPDASFSFAGTEGYIPPEGPGKPSADLYALGKVLYEMSTGHDRSKFPNLPSFVGMEEREQQRLRDLNLIFLKACLPNTRERYRTAKEMRNDLWLLQAGESIERLHAMTRAFGLLKLASKWAVVLIVFAASVFGVWFYKNRAEEQEHRAESGEAKLSRSGWRVSGWSKNNWVRLQQTPFSQRNDEWRADVVAVLAGLDAQEVWLSKELSAASVCFGSDCRLLTGGSRGSPGLIITTNGVVTELPARNEGPVCWPAGDVPLQLIASNGCSLLEMGTGVVRRDFPLKPGEAVNYSVRPVLAVTLDGTRVAAAITGRVDRVVAWDARNGESLGEFPMRAEALAFSPPDGSVLAAGDGKGKIEVVALPGMRRISTLSLGRPLATTCLALGRDPLVHYDDEKHTNLWFLAAGYQGGEVIAWDLFTHSPRSFCRGSDWNVFAVALDLDGLMVASAGRNKPRLFDVGSSRVDLQACKLEYSIVSPK